MLPSSAEILQILGKPFTPVDLDAVYEFETIELGGAYMLVDSEVSERLGAMLALTILPADRPTGAAIPLLVDLLDLDRTSHLPTGPLFASLTRGPVTRQAQRKVDTLVFLVEADMACQTAARLALASRGAAAVPALLAALYAPGQVRRCGAASTLGLMGRLAAAALPVLERLLAQEQSGEVQEAVREASTRIAAACANRSERHRAAS